MASSKAGLAIDSLTLIATGRAVAASVSERSGRTTGAGTGDILTRVQDLQLEGALTTREEALEWVQANRDRADG